MQSWVIIEEKYLNYLRKEESRIPFSDYGKDKYKPFFGILFEVEDLVYVTQISHAKKRHERMKSNIDFIKIYISGELCAVVNLNYMFPIHKSLIEDLQYKDIEKHREFSSQSEKTKYIDLLKKEMAEINKANVKQKASKLYLMKTNHPDNNVSKRCLDFAKLEKMAMDYYLNIEN